MIVDGLLNIVILLAILVGLVVIHELGHFVVARRAGVRVHEFGIGFPPRALDPPPRQGDDLLAQLAAHRRLRAPGRGGGRIGRPARLRQPAAPDAPRHPARRRGHELPARVASSSRSSRWSPTRSRTSASASRPGRTRRPRRRAHRRRSRSGTDADGNGRPDLRRVGRPHPRRRRPALPGLRRIDARATAPLPLPPRARRPDGRADRAARRRRRVEDVEVTLRPPAEIAPSRARSASGPRRCSPDERPARHRSTPLAHRLRSGRWRRRRSSCAALGGAHRQPRQPAGRRSGRHRRRRRRASARAAAGLLGLAHRRCSRPTWRSSTPAVPAPGRRPRRDRPSSRRVSGNRISVAAERAVYLTGFVVLMALLVWVTARSDIRARLGSGADAMPQPRSAGAGVATVRSCDVGGRARSARATRSSSSR